MMALTPVNLRSVAQCIRPKPGADGDDEAFTVEKSVLDSGSDYSVN